MSNHNHLSLFLAANGFRVLALVATVVLICSSVSARGDSVVVTFDDDSEDTVEYEGKTIREVRIVREGDSCHLPSEYMCDHPREVILQLIAADEGFRWRYSKITEYTGAGLNDRGWFVLDTNRFPRWEQGLEEESLPILLFLPQGPEW